MQFVIFKRPMNICPEGHNNMIHNIGIKYLKNELFGLVFSLTDFQWQVSVEFKIFRKSIKILVKYVKFNLRAKKTIYFLDSCWHRLPNTDVRYYSVLYNNNKLLTKYRGTISKTS